ncbi:hypothetical protein QOL99_14460 [Deinococcus sp. MIMF12]|uniref:DUF3568 family protein n=1 Tax=Deinococcus rhizophilus TaxID=3049544 RepID=A0ABT7JK53_9DEIO|nr:hypothetical protein [Deinococcus rhizophilus]MDL2345341.1 hypothetical protein [Deinococcus rhizophilus]
MRASFLLPLLAASLLLPGCALGASIAASTALERAVGGVYEGVGSGLTGRVPYRLLLSVQEREGRATGVLTNLESRKAYAVSGTFQRVGTTGGSIEVNLYESGDNLRGTLRAEIGAGKVSGTLRTVLLGRELLTYNLTLDKQEAGVGAATTPASPKSP